MGAPKGNANAKKSGKTRIDMHLSISDTKSNPRLARVCKHLEKQGKESTDQEIANFVKEGFYKYLDEVLSDVEVEED